MGGLLRQVLSTFAAPAAAFLAGPVLARVLGPDGRGELAAATSAVILITTVCAAGLPETAALVTARKSSSASDFVRRHLVSVILLVALSVAGCIACSVLLFGDSKAAQSIMIVGAIAAPLLLLVEIIRGARVGDGQLTLVQSESYINNFGRLGAIICLAAIGTLSTFSAGLVTVSAMVVGGLVLFCSRKEHSPEGYRSAIRREESATARRIWPGNVATQANLRLDQVLMVVLTTASQIGLYAVAVSVSQIFSLAVFGLRSFLFKSIARDENGAGVARILRILIPLMLVSLLAAVPLSPLVIPLLFGADYTSSIPMLQILLVGTIPLACGGILGVALNAAGKAALQSTGQWIGLIVAVSVLTLLAANLGGVGAALASSVGYLASGVWSAACFRRTYGISWKKMLVLETADVHWIAQKLRKRQE